MSTRTPTRTSRLVFIRGRLLSRVVRRQKTSRAQLRSDTRTLSRFPWNFTLLGHYLERVTRPSSPATLFSLRRFGYASAFLSRLASGADELLLSMVDEVGKKKKKRSEKRIESVRVLSVWIPLLLSLVCRNTFFKYSFHAIRGSCTVDSAYLSSLFF